MEISHSHKGITLVEVLVALLVLGIGVMGFAALQLRAVDTTSTTYSRTQAMAVARDLIERINVNPDAWPSGYGDTSDNWTVDISEAPNACMVSESAGTPDCDSDAMALADVNDIRRTVDEFLFDGDVVVEENCRDEQVACAIVTWNGTSLEDCDPDSISVSDNADNSNANCVIVEFWPQRAVIALAEGGGA